MFMYFTMKKLYFKLLIVLMPYMDLNRRQHDRTVYHIRRLYSHNSMTTRPLSESTQRVSQSFYPALSLDQFPRASINKCSFFCSIHGFPEFYRSYSQSWLSSFSEFVGFFFVYHQDKWSLKKMRLLKNYTISFSGNVVFFNYEKYINYQWIYTNQFTIN